MKVKIINLCKQIEKEKNIKILFCVESGSRIWGLSSKNSDYDVRFVFVRPLGEYIKIDKSNDVISRNYDKEGNPMSAEGCIIDFVGFDIFKFTKMLSASNPTTIEWLQSNLLYYGQVNKVFKEYAEKQFNPISLYYHYKSMCKQNYLKYLKSGNNVTYKKYLYAMRGLINAKYIVEFKFLPFIDFNITLRQFKDMNKMLLEEMIPEFVLDKLREIIKLKKTSKEKDIVQNIVKIDKYIEKFLKDDSDAPEKKKTTTDTILNEELRKIVLKK